MLSDFRPLRGDSRPRVATLVNSTAKTVAKVELSRKKFGLSQQSFCEAAGVNLRSYQRFLTGQYQTRPAFITRIEAAAAGAAVPQPHPKLIAAMHRSTMAVVAAELGHDVREILAVDFSSNRTPRWAAQVRRIAMYVLVIEAAIANGAALARAIGCSKQNVSQACDAIEEMREDGNDLDRLIQKIPL